MAMKFKVGEAPWEVQGQAAQAEPTSFAVGQAPWEQGTPPAPPQETDNYSTGESLLQGFGQGVGFGYLPQMQAGTEWALNKILPESMGGGRELTYQQARDQWVQRNQAIAEEDPGAYLTGNIAGAVAIPGMGAAKGGSALMRIARGAGMGAAYGAAANPGDTVGAPVGELQLEERGKNAALGAAIGGALPAVGAAYRGLKTGGKKLVAGMTGVPQKALETYGERGAEVDALIANNKVADLADDVTGKVQGKLDEARQAARVDVANGRLQTAEDLVSKVDEVQNNVETAKNIIRENLEGLKVSRAEQKMKVAEEARANIVNRLKNRLGSEDVDTAIAQKLQDDHSKLRQAFFANKQQLGNLLAERVQGAKGQVDARRFVEPYADLISQLRNSELAQTPAGKAEIAEMIGMVKNMFGGLQQDMTAKGAWDLQDLLRSQANLQNITGTFQSRFGAGASRLEKMWSNASKKAYDAVNAELERVAGTAGLKNAYAKTMRLQDAMETQFSTPEQMYKTLSNFDRANKVFAKQLIAGTKNLGAQAGVDLTDTAELIAQHARSKLPPEKLLTENMSAFIDKAAGQKRDKLVNQLKRLEDSFANPDKTLNTLETLGTEKNLRGGANADLVELIRKSNINPREAAKDIQAYRRLQRFDKAKTPKELAEFSEIPSMKKYVNLKNMTEKHFSTPEKTFKTLSGIEAPSRAYTKKVVGQIENQTGVPIQSNADLLEAARYFAKPGLVPYSGGYSTSTSRTLTGTAIGGALGSAIGGPVGGAVGSAAGLAATSPLAVKKLMQTYRTLMSRGEVQKAKAVMKQLEPYLQQVEGYKMTTPWINMGQ